MQQPYNRIQALLERLLTEGEQVIASQFTTGAPRQVGRKTWVDFQLFTKWRASCRLLSSLLNPVGNPWSEALEREDTNNLRAAFATQGTLQAIKAAVEDGLLIRYHDLVLAEAFSDLTEQAEYLLEQNYFLAAGVLFRAILEERLKQMCSGHAINPGKTRPTINDYNTALYKAQVYDKLTFKQVDAMAAAGNDAAHNNPALTKTTVERLQRDLADFLLRFSA